MLTQNLHNQAVQRVAKRFLVLGSTLQTAVVTSHSWSELPLRLTLANYDVVILNLVSFAQHQREGSICPERLPAWQQLGRLLFSGSSEIICVGLPSFEPGNALYQSLFWWLPVMPECVLEEGETVRDVQPEFAFYFEHVRRWFFYSTPTFHPHFLGLPRYLKQIHPYANALQAGMGAIARTPVGQMLSFKLVFRLSSVHRALPATARGNSSEEAVPLESGTVIWLPPPTEITPDEAIALLLRERYGLLPHRGAPPPWATSYGLPHQQAIAARIRKKQQDVEQLKRDIARMQRQLNATTHYHRLLYEQHPEDLVSVVGDVLRSLGASTCDLLTDTTGLVRLVSPKGQEALMLIRTHGGMAPLADLRQLDQWVRERLFQGDWQGRGLLLVNTEYHKPPIQRGEAFPPKAIHAAQHFGYGLITSVQLFQAIATHQQGSLNLQHFWQSIMTSGICPLPTVTATVPAQESEDETPVLSKI